MTAQGSSLKSATARCEPFSVFCHVSLVAFSGGKCRACLALPEVPASDLPVLIHSRWTASCQAICGICPRQV